MTPQSLRVPTVRILPAKVSYSWAGGMPNLFWIIAFKSSMLVSGLTSKVVFFLVASFKKICMTTLGTPYTVK